MLVMDMFDKVKHLKGEVIEFGVAAGATTFPLARLMQEFGNKKLYAMDTFSGLPYGEGEGELALKKGEINYGNVFKQILNLDPIENIVMVEGLAEETVELVKDNSFCLAWIDMDLGHPTQIAYDFLQDRMVHGGIIGFHDYGFSRCPMIKPIVDAIDKDKFEIIYCDYNCAFLRRK
jgi:predicted O-methyltransferase YrrM